MTNLVIDAHSWVEYFQGTDAGKKVKDLIENPINANYTNIITIAELSSFFQRKGYDFKEAKKVILSISKTFEINLEFAEEAGKLHAITKKQIKHIGLVDVFVLLTARRLNAKVITGDEDFKGFKETILIK